MLRLILRRLLSLLAAVASGGVVMSCPAYGMPDPGADPDVEITDFSYTPTGSVSRGTDVIFRATLNHAPLTMGIDDVHVLLRATGGQPGSYWSVEVPMLDDGYDPDAFGNDLIYTGAWEVSDDCPLGELQVTAQYSYVDSESAPSLIITEDEQ